MNRTTFILAASLATTSALSVANSAERKQFLLRDRIAHPLTQAEAHIQLRPRLEKAISALQSASMPRLEVYDDGSVGRLAEIETPHPNLVLTVGAVHDTSELGRRIDRAIIQTPQDDPFFNNQGDRAPFIGIGLRRGATERGLSFGGSIGAAVMNEPDSSRLSVFHNDLLRDRYEVETRANLRVKYTF